jgi:hypothetical protein
MLQNLEERSVREISALTGWSEAKGRYVPSGHGRNSKEFRRISMETDPSDKKLERLFAAARKAELYEVQREYGFEARVIAKIRSRREGLIPFFSIAWRLIPVFVSLVILLGIWTYATEPRSMIDLSAITKIGNEEAMLTASLAGE